jgi:sialidase-1
VASEALLNRGFFVAYLDLPNIFGSPAAVLVWDHFYDVVRKEFGLAPKVAIEAVSRGGLFAYNWAAKNPDKVACIFAESPVCDMKSWPGGRGRGIGSRKDWQEALAAYGFTDTQMMKFRGNPIDYAEQLARRRIPLLHIVYRGDHVVPPSENTVPFAARYRRGGGEIEVRYNRKEPATDHGHHFDLDDRMLEVRFVVAHSRKQ